MAFRWLVDQFATVDSPWLFVLRRVLAGAVGVLFAVVWPGGSILAFAIVFVGASIVVEMLIRWRLRR